MKKYFVEIENKNNITIVTPRKKSEVKESVYQAGVRKIDAKIVKKYNLKAGMSAFELKEKYEHESEMLDEIFYNAPDAPAISEYEDYLDVEALREEVKNQENNLYFDEFSDELYDAKTILEWDTIRVITHNFEVVKVKDECEIECKKICREAIGSYISTCYTLINGNKFIIYSPKHKGAFDFVINADSIKELKELAKAQK
ncbi:MAG: hypothetical protein LBF71_04720 [Campylobacteraceae bacterium]|jgi:hypothetical protein|nr:hypothetical protein [Campylobacteraceae bacterium]